MRRLEVSRSRLARRVGIVAVALPLLAGCAATKPEAPIPGAVPGGEVGVASYYGREFEGRRTASGKRYDPDEMVAAHRALPFGTRVRVTNLSNGKSAIVTIEDRGPHRKGRIIDLSQQAASLLGFIQAGTTRVRVEVVDGPDDDR